MTDQAENLRRQLTLKHNRKSAKTLCFISGKGGVGKSNVALNFAIKIHQSKAKVLLIDFDIGMGNIDVLQGVSSNKTIADLFDKVIPLNEMINVALSGVDYVSGRSVLYIIINLDNYK